MTFFIFKPPPRQIRLQQTIVDDFQHKSGHQHPHTFSQTRFSKGSLPIIKKLRKCIYQLSLSTLSLKFGHNYQVLVVKELNTVNRNNFQWSDLPILPHRVARSLFLCYFRRLWTRKVNVEHFSQVFGVQGYKYCH